ncbi:Hypothetical predicted protein, partial [Marmota monax]
MARIILLLLLGLVAVCAVHGVFMERLASKKLCADEECVYTISLASAQEDYNAPDCRFINVKKGQQIYVYSKLVKENEAGEFWAGSISGLSDINEVPTLTEFPGNQSEREVLVVTKFFLSAKRIPAGFALTDPLLGIQVYGDHQDEMGIVGYFPSNLVKEQHVYQEATKEVPTT